ncbi:hypothetical protein OAA60_03500 [Porticoccaceae bacterium]|nr:hypothetical protein [Porticoccaceae bacterium]
MASEKREIEISLKSKSAESSADKLNKKVKGVGVSADKTEKSLFTMTKTAASVTKALTISFAATAASVVALTSVVADYSKEIKIASQLSGVAAEDLQLMAFATNTVGISLEDLGDKLKDTREKVGDFLNTGGGGFMDFVDSLKLTKVEARELATEFSLLSGDQILQRMVTMMEAGNVSAVQMSHALEGMASDATKLIPLLRDGGSEMKRLSDNMSQVTIPLTDDDIDLFIRMGQSTEVAASALKSLGEQVLLNLGEAFIVASDRAAHFYASLNEGTEAQKTTRLVEISDEIKAITDNYEKLDNWFNKAISSEEGFNEQQQEGAEKVNALLEERIKIQKELAASRFGIGEESPSIDSTNKSKPNDPSNIGGVGAEAQRGAGGSFIEKIKLETEQLRTELAIRQELQLGNITEEQARDAEELNSIAFNYEARRQAILDQEFQTEELRKEALALSHEQELLAIQSFEAKKMAVKEESAQGAIRLDQQELQAKVSLYQGLTGLAQVFTGNSKKASKALMVIQGALSAYQIYAASEAAAALVLATPPGPVLNPALIPAAAAISLKGKASAGAVLAGSVVGSISGGGGGGSISGVSSPSTPSAVRSPSPTVGSQQTQKTINFVGLENFGPDDFIPMTKSQFIDYMGQDEDVNIAVNNGQQNATRIGAI